MIIIDLADKSIIDYSVARNNRRKNVILLNPAEYFIYQIAKKKKISPDELCYELENADECVYYSRLGELITSFYSGLGGLFSGMDECLFERLFKNNIVQKVPFSENEQNDIECVFYDCFSDIGDLVIEEAKNEEQSVRKGYTIRDIKNLLLDRFNVELDCGVSNEELYINYVDKEKHSLFKEAEKVIWNSKINIKKFIVNNFDLAVIRDKIHSL